MEYSSILFKIVLNIFLQVGAIFHIGYTGFSRDLNIRKPVGRMFQSFHQNTAQVEVTLLPASLDNDTFTEGSKIGGSKPLGCCFC